METLSAIFGSEAKVKILRLFLFNPDTAFRPADIAKRIHSPSDTVRKELIVLVDADILKKRNSAKGRIYALNIRFPYLESLKNLLIVSSVSADADLLRRFAGIGRLKLVVAAGVFVQNWDSRIDLLIVGDGLNMRRIQTIMSYIEAELGKEITYSAFETHDFEYRFGIHDRLVRDILDYPHITLLDRLGIEPR